MDDVATKLTQLGSTNAGRFEQYKDYRFFTLGLHGYSQLNYSISDLYGSQGNSGQVIGTTYKGNDQRLVRTFGGQLGGDTAKNYPPPGITSATVERVRNGNVLKFTVQTQCYTQEQLEMLDVVCYVPGMTCVLEWGSLATTPTGTIPLEKILDFRNTEVAIGAIQFALTGPRSTFMDTWCKPNKYNYDWTVANIANIKTSLEDNIYKTTIVAYGRADNIMYLSAYATTNPQRQETNISTSLTNFFKLNQDFSNILKEDIVGGNPGLIKFVNPYNRAELLKAMPGAQETGQANDTGLEDTYFMTVNYFINRILNGPVREIVQSGLSYPLTYILFPEPTYVGWNENLRSTSPEVMIIYNKEANSNNKASQERVDSVIAQLSEQAREIGRIIPPKPDSGLTDPVIQKLDTAEDFKNAGGDNNGAALITKGIWLNSKAIQSAFINARTVMEGLEVLLRNMNAATEGYWDLKLYYDDDAQAFRILDDNLRIPKANANIYEFNKRLINTDGDVIGPDVLSIELKTDYPKLLFSQLAVAGINGGLDNLASSPDAKDVNFVRQTSVGDIFAKKQSQLGSATPSDQSTPQAGNGTPWASLLSAIDSSATITNLGADRLQGIRAFNTAYNTLQGGSGLFQLGQYAIPDGSQRFPNGIPPGVVSVINTVFSNPNLLDSAQANDIQRRLKAENLTQDQSAVITELFAQRAIAIITRDKQREVDRLEQAFNYARNTKDQNGNPLIDPALFTRDVGPATGVVKNKIIENRDQLIQEIRTNVSAVTRTGAGPTPPPPAVTPGQIGGGAIPGRAGRGGP
jgi:hypothetical protein